MHFAAVQVIAPLLRILEKMHAVKLLHRDIKPENIFLTGIGKFKLVRCSACQLAHTRRRGGQSCLSASAAWSTQLCMLAMCGPSDCGRC